MIGQGVANILRGFLVDLRQPVPWRVQQLMSAMVAIVLLLAPLASHIPLAALVGILFVLPEKAVAYPIERPFFFGTAERLE